MAAAIETEGLTKQYGAVPAVDDVTLSVPFGTVYGFVGPNGAGKTTTMRILAGLLRPDAGQAKICGIQVDDRPSLADILGYLPARAPVYDELTGREQLRYAAQFRRIDDENVVDRGLGQYGLLDVADRQVEGYSTGMRRKLGLAQATLHEPDVLLLDEPLNGLDPRATRTVCEMVTDASGGGTAVMVSSHDLSTIESICDRVGIVSEGTVVADGTPSELTAETDLESTVLELTER